LGLSALHQGRVDRAATDFDSYLAASDHGWWTGLQPLVPRLRIAGAEWLALEKSLPADRPRDALSQVRSFLADDPAALRPAADRKIAELQKQIRAEEQARQARQQRDQERMQTVTTTTARLTAQQRYAEAAAAIEQVMNGLETPQARTNLEARLPRLKRLASVRVFLAEQLTASPPPISIKALGGRIAGASVEKIFLDRIDGGGEKAWEDISPELYLKLLDYEIKTAEMGKEQRADAALSIAYYWHTQQREEVALRYGRLAVRLNQALREEAAELMPGLDFSPLPAPAP
jgi:hypothetical protein